MWGFAVFFFFFKQKTAYEISTRDWSSDVCSSDLFGLTNPVSKMAIVAIIVFFPTMINTVRGLTLIDPRQLELMQSYAASPMKILLSLRIPNALPYIFSALRVASPLSLIGAVVAEFFG